MSKIMKIFITLGVLSGCGEENVKVTQRVVLNNPSPSILIKNTKLEKGDKDCPQGGSKIEFYSDLDLSGQISEQDKFLESSLVCNGDQGPIGEVGATGSKGSKGDQGD